MASDNVEIVQEVSSDLSIAEMSDSDLDVQLSALENSLKYPSDPEDTVSDIDDVSVSESDMAKMLAQLESGDLDDANLEQVEEQTAEIPVPQRQDDETQVVVEQNPEVIRRAIAQIVNVSAQRTQAELSQANVARQQLMQANQQLAAKIEEIGNENPSLVFDLKAQLHKNIDHLSKLDRHEQNVRGKHNAISVVTSHAGEEFDVNAMSVSLARDGASPEMIESFKRDPFRWADGVALVQLAKRAYVEKLLTGVVRMNDALKAENERLKSKPQAMLQNIDKGVRRLSGQTGGASSNGSPAANKKVNLNSVRVETMSDADLDKYINQLEKINRRV